MEAERGRGNFIERNDWKVWVVLTLLFAFIGFEGIRGGGEFYGGEQAVEFGEITGTTWEELKASDPGAARLIDYQARGAGAFQLAPAFVFLAVVLFGLRRRQRWAWVAMWILPLNLVLLAVIWVLAEKAPGAPSIGSTIVAPIVFFVLTVALLLATYHKYNSTG